MPDLSFILGAIGIITFVGGVVSAVANRSVSNDRIDHLEGLVDALKEDLERERHSCERRINEMQVEVDRQKECIARLTGQLEAATGDLGKRIAQVAAQEIIERLADDGHA